MKLCLYILFFCATFPLFCLAQGNIGGCVKNEKNRALPDANVLFFQLDSLVAGITTDKKGCFSLRMNSGKYQMHISYLGYSEYTDSIQLPQSGLSLPVIVMKEAPVELAETVVSGEKPIYEAQSNKTIFNVSSQIKKSSSDAFQVLSNVPPIVVDVIEKKIKQLVGSDNFVVMVNNIRRNNGYLMSIRPENIDKVEIIRDPGARYSSKNIDGIINIVTKSPIRGESGYIGWLLNPKFFNFNGGYTHVGEKLSVTLSGQDFFFNEKKREISIMRDMRKGNNIIHTEKQSNQSNFKMNSLYLSPTFDYTFSPKAYLTLNTNYTNSPQKSNTPYSGFVLSDNQKMYDFTAMNQNSNKYEKYEVNPYFQINLSKNRSLNMEIDYVSMFTKNNSSYVETQGNGILYANNQLNRNRQKSLDAQINYQQQIQKVNLEGGYRTFWQNNDFYNETNGAPNPMKYRENRNYIYIDGLGGFGKKFTYQAGIGFDIVNTEINKSLTHHFYELTPSAMLRYKINNSKNVTLDYMKMRQSPSFSLLNPTPFFTDSSRVVTGNPSLTPYYLNRFRLSYEWMNNRYYIWTSIQYRFANNFISTVGNYDDNGTYHITYANAKHYSSTSSYNLNFSVDVLKGWKIMANGTMEYRIYGDTSQVLIHKRYWTPSLWIMSMINYKKLYVNFSWFPFFRTPTLTGYEKPGGESSLTANYNLSKHWSIQAGLRYLFPMIYTGETYADGFTEIFRDNMTERYFRFLIGAQYNFQSGKQKNYKQKATKDYDDNVDIGTKVY